MRSSQATVDSVSIRYLKRLRVVLSFIYVSSCLMGCLIQCLNVTSNYLAYEVLTKLSVYLPSELRTPGFTVCFRYVDILNLTKYSEMYNVSAPTALDDETVRAIQSKIKIKSIFDLSPGGSLHHQASSVQKLISSCSVRSPHGYLMSFINGTRCSQSIFTIDRFFIQEYLCYKHILRTDYLLGGRRNNSRRDESSDNQDPDNGLKYNFKRLALSMIYPNVFYSIQLSLEEGLFGRADRMRTIIHSAGDLPFVSLSLSPILYRKALSLEPDNLKNYLQSLKQDKNATGPRIKYKLRDMFNHIAARFARVQIRRLPAPYTSNCRPRYLRNSCISNCTFDETIRSMKKIPFQNLFAEAGLAKYSGMTIVSVEDVKAVETNKKMKAILSFCQKRCLHDSCYTDYSITSSDTSLTNEETKFSFEIGCAYEPFISNKSVPSVTLNDYLLQLLSLIGFWLGLSVRETNPVAYFSRCMVNVRKLVSRKNIQKMLASPVPVSVKAKGDSVYCIKTRNMFTLKVQKQFLSALTVATKQGYIVERSELFNRSNDNR